MKPIIFIHQGMEITEEVDRTTEELIIERSMLKLIEVSLNVSTIFRCSTRDGQYYEDISFRVNGDLVKEQQINFSNY